MKTVVSTPIDFPLIEPCNWNDWWSMWYKENKIIPKVLKNHNQRSAIWRGFDIFVRPGIDSVEETRYKASNLNCLELFPSLFLNLDKLPIEVDIIRAVSSCTEVYPHTDQENNNVSVRSMLYDNNVRKTFYYYLNDNKVYQDLPKDTNTWLYWDNKVTHGTDFYTGHSKILFMYFGKNKQPLLETTIQQSSEKYKDYVIWNE